MRLLLKKRSLRRTKTRASRKTRSRQMQTNPRLRVARKLPTHLQVIVGVKAKNRFLKLIRITGTRFTRKRRNDNWMSGPHFDLRHVLGRLVRLGVALSPAVIKPRLTAGIDPTHRAFLGSSLENFFRRFRRFLLVALAAHCFA